MPRPIKLVNQSSEPDKNKVEPVAESTQALASESKTEEPSNVKNPRVTQLYKELTAEKEALEKELAPYREYYEKCRNDPKFVEARAKIKELSAKLGPVHNELASIARAGGAKGIKIETGQFNIESK